MKLAAAVVALAALVGTSPAADPPAPPGKVAAPLYKNWAKFPAGTSVTHRMVTDSAGQKSESTMTHTLVELAADKAVVEVTTVVKAAGQEFKSPPVKQTYERYVDLPPNTEPGKQPKIEGLVEQGKKKVTAAGKEYAADYAKIKQTTGGLDVLSEVWTSDDVPGMTVKTTSAISGTVASSSTMELVEIKKPAAKK